MKITIEVDSKELVELISKVQAQLQRNELDKIIERITCSIQSQKVGSSIAEWRT